METIDGKDGRVSPQKHLDFPWEFWTSIKRGRYERMNNLNPVPGETDRQQLFPYPGADGNRKKVGSGKQRLHGYSIQQVGFRPGLMNHLIMESKEDPARPVAHGQGWQSKG
jgi:hypothetical protein